MEYEKQVKQCHPNLKLRKAGIYIGNPPYLGASPDGMLEDHWGNPSGVIEIKCPYSVPKSMECITINFDQHLWETLLSKLQNFYIDYMLPVILY